MGLDFEAIELLLLAGPSSGYFSSVITLGRQELQGFDGQSLKTLLDEHGRPVSLEKAEAILHDGDRFAEPLLRFLAPTRWIRSTHPRTNMPL